MKSGFFSMQCFRAVSVGRTGPVAVRDAHGVQEIQFGLVKFMEFAPFPLSRLFLRLLDMNETLCKN